MRQYVFDNKSYGAYWSVMASTPESALEFLIAYLKKERPTKHKEWKNSTWNSLPKNYVLREYGVGEVVSHEYS